MTNVLQFRRRDGVAESAAPKAAASPVINQMMRRAHLMLDKAAGPVPKGKRPVRAAARRPRGTP